MSFLDATDRITVSAAVVATHAGGGSIKGKEVDTATVGEVRSRRPIAAIVASVVGNAVAEAVASSRKEDLRNLLGISTRTTKPITALPGRI